LRVERDGYVARSQQAFIPEELQVKRKPRVAWLVPRSPFAHPGTRPTRRAPQRQWLPPETQVLSLPRTGW